MKDHPNVEHAELVAYLDGELPEERAEWWQAHLETCESCAGLADELKSLTGAIRDLPDPAALYNIAIQPDEKNTVSSPAIHRRSGRRWLPLALAASLAIFVWSGYALWRSSIKIYLIETTSLSGPSTEHPTSEPLNLDNDLPKIAALYPPTTPPDDHAVNNINSMVDSSENLRTACQARLLDAFAYVGLSRIGDMARAQVLDLERCEIIKVSRGDTINDGLVLEIDDKALTVEFPYKGKDAVPDEMVRVAFPMMNGDMLGNLVSKYLAFEKIIDLSNLGLPLKDSVSSDAETPWGQFMVLSSIAYKSLDQPTRIMSIHHVSDMAAQIDSPAEWISSGIKQIFYIKDMGGVSGEPVQLSGLPPYDILPRLEYHLAHAGEKVGPFDVIEISENSAGLALGSLHFSLPLRKFWDSPDFQDPFAEKGAIILDFADVMNELDLGPDGKFDMVQYKARRVSKDMRSLAVALESYYIDNNTYPIPEDANSAVLDPATANVPLVGYIPHSLTTPIIYMKSIPIDPFWSEESASAFNSGRSLGLATYRYATTPITCWIVTSNGPDQNADFDLHEYVDKGKAACDIVKALSQFGMGGSMNEYDPTNGTTSGGDIFRTGP